MSGTTEFAISNARDLTADLMVSGRTRASLERAYTMVVQQVLEEQARPNAPRSIVNGGDEQNRMLRGGGGIDSNTDDEQDDYHHRRLVVSIEETDLTRIDDIICSSQVPADFLCQRVFTSYRLRVANEPLNRPLSAIRDAVSGGIVNAIRRGDLQDDLDFVFPDSKVAIEEGNNIRRPSKSILETTADLISLAGTAGIGAGIFVFLLFCFCAYKCYCRRRNNNSDDDVVGGGGATDNDGGKTKATSASTRTGGLFGRKNSKAPAKKTPPPKNKDKPKEKPKDKPKEKPKEKPKTKEKSGPSMSDQLQSAANGITGEVGKTKRKMQMAFMAKRLVGR